MPGVSMVAEDALPSVAAARDTKRSSEAPFTAITRPGLVQNWPAPRVGEPTKASARASAPFARASGHRNTGLTLLISANTGIGTGRSDASLSRASPPRLEPVKPTAMTRGSCTSAWPRARSGPEISENTPSGSPASRTAASIAAPASALVPGCAGWPRTSTGQPAASAAAVSPPATENASGKLLAPNTATGPTGMRRRRRSGRGSGLRSGRAGSSLTPSQSPERTTAANKRSWPVVRPSSPVMRASGSPDSDEAVAISSVRRASRPAAMASRKHARASGAVAR